MIEFEKVTYASGYTETVGTITCCNCGRELQVYPSRHSGALCACGTEYDEYGTRRRETQEPYDNYY